MDYPKVLVISNNSFSLSNSNGRTLGLLFKGWPKESLAQFCFNSEGPLWDVCENYYCVSDVSVIKSFFSFRSVKRDDLKDYVKKDNVTVTKIPRTAFFSIARHIIWKMGLWQGKSFYSWLNSFAPEIVIIQSGDTAFTHDLARRIAAMYKAKLVFFNTEGIYFINKNYFNPGVLDGLFFPIYKSIYKKAYEKAMDCAAYSFYLHEGIQADNDKVFNVPSCVIHTSSSLHPSYKEFNTLSPIISYFGNFAFGRDKALLEVASYLQEMDTNLTIHIYGKASEDLALVFDTTPGVCYHGFLPYEVICDVIQESDILIHVESHDESYYENLKYGFSTKIADCLSSGRSFLIYSPSYVACFEYLKNNDCAWTASDKLSFQAAISQIIHNESERNRVMGNAVQVADRNHCLENNRSLFQQKLIEATSNVNHGGRL